MVSWERGVRARVQPVNGLSFQQLHGRLGWTFRPRAATEVVHAKGGIFTYKIDVGPRLGCLGERGRETIIH